MTGSRITPRRNRPDGNLSKKSGAFAIAFAHANGLVAGAKNIEKLGEILTLNKGVYEDEFGYIAIERRFCESECEESLNLLNDIIKPRALELRSSCEADDHLK